MAVAAPGYGATRERLPMLRAGLWLFFFSESVLFGLLLTTRFYLLGIDREHVDQLLGLGITSILLLSSVTAFTAETAIEHNRQDIARWGLIATIVLGLIFTVGVGFEWATAEFSREEAFGSVFFTMTGIHATHVISGIVVLILVLAQQMRGKYSRHNHWPLSGAVMYWHFVDVVWVFFYPALYLVS
jgi:cytochrome c oxidase subunit 3